MIVGGVESDPGRSRIKVGLGHVGSSGRCSSHYHHDHQRLDLFLLFFGNIQIWTTSFIKRQRLKNCYFPIKSLCKNVRSLEIDSKTSYPHIAYRDSGPKWEYRPARYNEGVPWRHNDASLTQTSGRPTPVNDRISPFLSATNSCQHQLRIRWASCIHDSVYVL